MAGLKAVNESGGKVVSLGGLEAGNPETLLPMMVPEGRPEMSATGVGAMAGWWIGKRRWRERFSEVRSSRRRD